MATAPSPTTNINNSPLAAAQVAGYYGPQTQTALRRSQYLADALRMLTSEGAQNIRSPGELGAKLLATAILQRANDKGQDALTKALAGDQQADTDKLLGPLQAALTQQSAPAAPPAALPAQAQAPEPPPPQAPQPTSAPGLSDADRLAIARTVYGEARGEPVAGQQAVADVILNRARASGKSPAGVVAAPHQFAGFNPKSQALTPDQLQPILNNIGGVLDGTAPDVTGGADHFFNPALANPAWGQGDGQMIGQHKFVRLDDQGHAQPDVQMTAGPAPQGPLNVAPTMAAAQGAPPAQPYQVASAGPTPPPPSAPGSSPSAAGAPPAALPPQAPAAAGGLPANWPTWKPSPAEVSYVQGLLNDPRTHEQGRQAALQMQQKMTQPVEATVQIINGVPFYVAKDPTSGAPTMAIPVPREAMTQHAEGPAAGLPAGAQVDISPTGNRNVVYKPPEGYQSNGQGGLQYQPGGPADPTRVQAPPAGYQFSGGHYAPIPGGPNDLQAPQNVAQGTQRYSEMVKPIVDAAMKVRQNYGAVTTGYKQGNGTGDIAMVNGLQKLIDEGVVRGEDVNLQMKSNGISGSIGSITQYLQSGGLLTPDVRDKLYRTANDLYHNLDSTYRTRVQSLQPGVDKLYGPGAFETYVFPKAFADQMGWSAAPQGGPGSPAPPPVPAPGANAPAGSPDAVLAEAVRRKIPLNAAQQARAKQLGLIQ